MAFFNGEHFTTEGSYWDPVNNEFHGDDIYDYLKTLGIAKMINNSDELSLALIEEFKEDREKNVMIADKIENYGQNLLNNTIEELKKYI